MRFQYKTLPQIIRLKTNRHQAEGLSYYCTLLNGIRLNIYLHYPEEQAPPNLLVSAIPCWHILSIHVRLYGSKRDSHKVCGSMLNKS